MSEWRFTGTDGNGEKVEVNGCAVFTFRAGTLPVQPSYRKIRTPAG